MAGLALWAANHGRLTVGASARNRLAGIKLAATAHNTKVASAAAATVTLRSTGAIVVV